VANTKTAVEGPIEPDAPVRIGERGPEMFIPTEPPYARFVGGEGTFYGGIPARNLTRAEWDELPLFLQQAAIATQLYEVPPAAKAAVTKALAAAETPAAPDNDA
jgi:hypothetical protein